jgi:hypothetical protein
MEQPFNFWRRWGYDFFCFEIYRKEKIWLLFIVEKCFLAQRGKKHTSPPSSSLKVKWSVPNASTEHILIQV